MNKFATQAYYDEVIAAIVATGARLLSQVQITSDDFPYYVTADFGRSTTLVFDLPGKALFMKFTHNEMTGFTAKDVYDNHWTTHIDCEYLPLNEMLNLINGTFDGVLSEIIAEKQNAYSDLAGTSSGWSMSADNKLIFTSDVAWNDHSVFVPVSMLKDVAAQVFGNIANHDYLAKSFEEMSPMWHPHYVFDSDKRGAEGDAIAKAVENCFWERFAENNSEATKIMREKIGKGH